MKTEFERSLHNNYMVIRNTEEPEVESLIDIENNYQVRMLSETEIEGFLLLKVRYFNGKAEFCYDISAKQKMSDWFKSKKINNTELRNILLNLCEVLDRAEDYLLDVNHIVLNPDYIFVDMDKYLVYLCYCPLYEEDIVKTGQEFLQYLLEILDYNDKPAVEMGYEVFRLCMKNGFGINIIKNYLADKQEAIVEETEEWNSVVPVSVMKEEVEDEYEKPIIPYFELPFRRKICIALMLAEIMLSVLLIPLLGKSVAAIFIYVILTVVFMGMFLTLRVFYNKLQQQLTRIVSVKGYIAYEDKESDYIYESEEEASKGKTKKPETEETVLLAYTGKNERFRRLHYIGTRTQEDIILTNYPFMVGKATEGNDYCLSYPFVSRVHFRIEKDEDKYYITDTNSRNGLSINGESLNATETKELCVGDRIELGDLVFLFQ